MIRRLLALLSSSEVHDGPNECGRSGCDLPECQAPKGTCCLHCPVTYRRSQR